MFFPSREKSDPNWSKMTSTPGPKKKFHNNVYYGMSKILIFGCTVACVLTYGCTVACVLTYGYSSSMCSYLWIAVACVLTYGYSSSMCSYLWI